MNANLVENDDMFQTLAEVLMAERLKIPKNSD